jgi:hypothetical protein
LLSSGLKTDLDECEQVNVGLRSRERLALGKPDTHDRCFASLNMTMKVILSASEGSVSGAKSLGLGRICEPPFALGDLLQLGVGLTKKYHPIRYLRLRPSGKYSFSNNYLQWETSSNIFFVD